MDLIQPRVTISATPMYVLFSRAIQSCFTLIVSNVDPEEIAGYLYECRLISIGLFEQLLMESLTKTQRCRRLGLALVTSVRTPKNFEDLLFALRPDYDYIANRLQQYVDNGCRHLTDNNQNGDGLELSLAKSSQNTEDLNDLKYPTQESGLSASFSAAFKHVGFEHVDSLKNSVADIEGITDFMDSNLKFDQSNLDRGISFGNTKHPTKKCDCCCANEKVYRTRNQLDVVSISGLLPNYNSSLKFSPSFRQKMFNQHDVISIPGLLPPSNHGFKFSTSYHQKMFNQLATLVNNRNLTLFKNQLSEFDCRPCADPDAACIALYLEASSSVMNLDVERSNQIIHEGLHVIPFTKTPIRFIVKLLSLRVWSDLNCEKLPSDLGKIKQLIHQDPVSCRGMVAAWNYVNEAKSCMIQIKSSLSDSGLVAQLLDRAIVSYRCALQQFSIDKTYDGPYGFSYAALKLVSTLLACDDKMHLVNSDYEFHHPNNLPEAQRLLEFVSEAEEVSAKTLESLSFIAQADYMFRSKCFKKAYQLAKLARRSAIESQLNHEKTCAELRCQLYGSLVKKDFYFTTSEKNSETRNENEFRMRCDKNCCLFKKDENCKRAVCSKIQHYRTTSLFVVIFTVLFLCGLLTLSSLWSALR